LANPLFLKSSEKKLDYLVKKVGELSEKLEEIEFIQKNTAFPSIITTIGHLEDHIYSCDKCENGITVNYLKNLDYDNYVELTCDCKTPSATWIMIDPNKPFLKKEIGRTNKKFMEWKKTHSDKGDILEEF